MTQSRPRSESANACSAVPPCTSRSLRASSRTYTSTARSATTSATRSTQSSRIAASTPTESRRFPGGKTFFWKGHYEFDLNTAHTDDTQLNVFETFEPKLNDAAKEADVLFLANIEPGLQRAVREQCPDAKFVALDSMNLWIDIAKDSLIETIKGVDAVFMNDAEIRALTGQSNMIKAAREVLSLGTAPRGRQAGRVRRRADHRGQLLRAPRVPA